MDTRYRIYTEDLNLDLIETAASIRFDSFSITHQTGYWHGQSEPSIVIEVLGTHADSGKVQSLALWIKAKNNQEAVLVTRETVSGQLI